MVVPSLSVPNDPGIGCAGMWPGFVVSPVGIGAHSGPVVRPVVPVHVGVVCVLSHCVVFGCVEFGLVQVFHSGSVLYGTHLDFVQFGGHLLVQVGSFGVPVSLWEKSDCMLAVSPGCMVAVTFVCSLAGYFDSIVELLGMWLVVVPCLSQTPFVVSSLLHSSCSNWTVIGSVELCSG